jgi:hypothetical protein
MISKRIDFSGCATHYSQNVQELKVPETFQEMAVL